MENDSIRLTDLRAKIAPFILNSGVLTREGTSFRFDQRVQGTVPNLNLATTYRSQDEAVDAIFRAWFPNYVAQKAA